MPFGAFGRFPFRFGGGRPVKKVVRDAMLLSLSPEPGLGMDISDPGLRAEINAYAGVVSSIWRINGRVKGQSLPMQMLEALPDAELVYGCRPTPDQSDNERRAAVAGKMLALRGNAMPDIEEAVRAIAGAQFVALETIPSEDGWHFWPGGDPGPPGLEWASSNCYIRVQLTKSGLPNDAAYERLRAAVINQLHVQVPASHIFAVSTGSSFTVGESLLGEAGL